MRTVCAARELFEEVGVRVDPADVHRCRPMGHAGVCAAPIRYALLSGRMSRLAKNRTLHTGEHDFGEWIRPADAVARWKEGQILMAAPVLHALRCLSKVCMTSKPE